MGKYDVFWCRIWDFREEVETETEEEVYEKILEERKTAGSTVQIISVMPIDIEEVKQKGKKEREKRRVAVAGTVPKAQEIIREEAEKQTAQKKKEKK